MSAAFHWRVSLRFDTHSGNTNSWGGNGTENRRAILNLFCPSVYLQICPKRAKTLVGTNEDGSERIDVDCFQPDNRRRYDGQRWSHTWLCAHRLWYTGMEAWVSDTRSKAVLTQIHLFLSSGGYRHSGYPANAMTYYQIKFSTISCYQIFLYKSTSD